MIHPFVILIADRVAGQVNLYKSIYTLPCLARFLQTVTTVGIGKISVKQLDLFMKGKIVSTVHLLKEYKSTNLSIRDKYEIFLQGDKYIIFGVSFPRIWNFKFKLAHSPSLRWLALGIIE